MNCEGSGSRSRALRQAALAVALVAAVCVGCGDDDGATSAPGSEVSTTTEAILIDRISSAGCQTDQTTLQTAIEAFRAQSTDANAVPNEAELVSGHFLSDESQYYDVKDTATGYAIVPTPGGGCD